MSDDPSRASIYAAMSAVEEEDAEERAKNNPFAAYRQQHQQNVVTVKTTDDKLAEVASGQYVKSLEQMLRQQRQLIEKLERQVARLSASLRNHRTTINQQSGRISDVSRELDNKIDRRD